MTLAARAALAARYAVIALIVAIAEPVLAITLWANHRAIETGIDGITDLCDRDTRSALRHPDRNPRALSLPHTAPRPRARP